MLLDHPRYLRGENAEALRQSSVLLLHNSHRFRVVPHSLLKKGVQCFLFSLKVEGQVGCESFTMPQEADENSVRFLWAHALEPSKLTVDGVQLLKNRRVLIA